MKALALHPTRIGAEAAAVVGAIFLRSRAALALVRDRRRSAEAPCRRFLHAKGDWGNRGFCSLNSCRQGNLARVRSRLGEHAVRLVAPLVPADAGACALHELDLCAADRSAAAPGGGQPSALVINGDFLGGWGEKSAVRPRCLFEFTRVDATK